MIHEASHAILHALQVENGEIAGKPEKERRTRKVGAESVAYVVCQHFRIETGDSSFAYVTSWSKNKELPELKVSLECISKTAAKLIGDIEENVPTIHNEEQSIGKSENKSPDRCAYKLHF